MWSGKKKAVTFSIDDGDTGDKRIIEIFNNKKFQTFCYVAQL